VRDPRSSSRAGSVASIGGIITIVVIIVVAAVIYVDSRGTPRSTVSPHASIVYSSSSAATNSSVAAANSTFTSNSTAPGYLVVANNNHTRLVKVSIIPGASKNSTSPGYSPDSMTVVIGVNNTITWTNEDNATHSVSATDNLFNSGSLSPTQSFTFTFTTAGTYSYDDRSYPWMHGSVTVLG
jgi:plastocyanin